MTNLKLGWLKLLREYVAAGCDIYGIRCDNESMSNRRRTPFLEVIYGFLNRCWVHVGTTSEGIEKVVQRYLHVLHNSGIDIVSHGQKEKKLHDKTLVDKDFSYGFPPRTYMVRFVVLPAQRGALSDARMVHLQKIGRFGDPCQQIIFWGSSGIWLRTLGKQCRGHGPADKDG
jgi:hypothetical protein